MAHLTKVVDKAIGYHTPLINGRSHDHLSREEFDPSLLIRPLDPTLTLRPDEVQERYVDYPELYSEHEKKGWEREGEMAAQRATQESLEAAKERNRSPRVNAIT